MKNKYRKLLCFVMVLPAFVFLQSCADELEQTNNNALSSGNFGTSTDQFVAAVNGAFHPLNTPFFFGRVMHTGPLLRSDEYNIVAFGENTSMSTFQAQPGSRWANDLWVTGFKSISRANKVIETLEGNTDISILEQEKNNVLGQAYFVRAFTYWYLVNLFKEVPLQVKSFDADDLFPSQSSFEEGIAFIVSDLKTAQLLLPATWEGDNLGRPTSGAATALLGKTYLYQKQWKLAHETLDDLVGQYSLLPADRYHENFGVTNENNEESVFELQFMGVSTFAWGIDVPGTGTQGNYHIDYAPPSKSPDRGHFINPWVRDLYETNGDEIRRNASLAYDYTGSTGYGSTNFLTDYVDDIALANVNNVPAIFSKKYAGLDLGVRDDVATLGENVGNNLRIIRYSDVLLMLAEALNEDGMTGAAETHINAVRNRVNLADVAAGISQDDMRTAIIDERAMELMGEGHRFFDLVRWGLADDYMGATSLHGDHPKSLSGGAFQSGRHEFIWIPNAELDKNPNLEQIAEYK